MNELETVPGKASTVGEWRVKVSMEMDQMNKNLETVAKKSLENSTILKEQTRALDKILYAIEKVDTIDRLEKELKEHKEDYSQLKGKISVWAVIFSLILSGVFGYFFITIRQKQPTISSPTPPSGSHHSRKKRFKQEN